MTVFFGIDCGFAQLLLEIILVIVRIQLEAVECWLIGVEGLAVWIMQIGIRRDVVEVITAMFSVAFEVDFDG